MVSKLVFDLVPIILVAASSFSKRIPLDDGIIRLVDYILLCCSSIFATGFEHFFLWLVHDRTSEKGLGWVIQNPGLIVTIVLDLALLVPLVKWRDELWQFWMISAVSCLHFLLFGIAHVCLIYRIRSLPRKWTRLASGFTACSIVTLSSVTSLVVGSQVSRARDLLPKVLLLCTSAQLLIRICGVVVVLARKELREHHGARNLIDKRYNGRNGRPSISTKQLIRDLEDLSSDIVHLSKESSSSIDPQPPSKALTPLRDEALSDNYETFDLPLHPRKKALIIIDVQDDSVFVKDDRYITKNKNRDLVPRLKELIPDVIWVCTHIDQEARLFQEGTRGAEIELLDMADEAKDLIVIKHHYSAFKQTSLLMALRKKMITDVYICGCLTNVDVFSTVADAVPHGLSVTVIEDCLGYRSEEEHKEAMDQMVEFMGIDKVDSEGVVNEYGGYPAPEMEPLNNPLEGLCLDTDETMAGGIIGATTKVCSTAP